MPEGIALSHSREENMACPFRFAALYIEKTYKEPESKPMIVGQEFSQIAEKYRKHCFKKSIETDLGWFDGIDFDSLRYPEEVGKIVENFKNSEFARIPYASEAHVIEAQMAFDKSVLPVENYFGKDVRYRGKLDFGYLQDGVFYVIDDKAGWGKPPPTQLYKYAYLAPLWMRLPIKDKIERIALVFNHVAQKRKESVASVTYDEVAYVADHIIKNIREVASWEPPYEAVPGKLCTRYGGCKIPDCPHKQEAEKKVFQVPDAPGMSQVPKKISDEVAFEEALKMYGYLKESLENLEKVIEEYVEEKGGGSAAGFEAGYVESNSWKPPEDQEQFLKQLMGLGARKEVVLQNLGLTKTRVEKIMKQSGAKDRIPMALALGEKSNGKKFKIGKAAQ